MRTCAKNTWLKSCNKFWNSLRNSCANGLSENGGFNWIAANAPITMPANKCPIPRKVCTPAVWICVAWVLSKCENIALKPSNVSGRNLDILFGKTAWSWSSTKAAWSIISEKECVLIRSPSHSVIITIINTNIANSSNTEISVPCFLGSHFCRALSIARVKPYTVSAENNTIVKCSHNTGSHNKITPNKVSVNVLIFKFFWVSIFLHSNNSQSKNLCSSSFRQPESQRSRCAKWGKKASRLVVNTGS